MMADPVQEEVNLHHRQQGREVEPLRRSPGQENAGSAPEGAAWRESTCQRLLEDQVVLGAASLKAAHDAD